jgi:membrane-bound lytic murein transglycosylase B
MKRIEIQAFVSCSFMKMVRAAAKKDFLSTSAWVRQQAMRAAKKGIPADTPDDGGRKTKHLHAVISRSDMDIIKNAAVESGIQPFVRRACLAEAIRILGAA